MTEDFVPYVVTPEPAAPLPATPEKKAFLAALAAAQGEFEPIERNREVIIEKKAGGSYKFKYAELAEILKKTRAGLTKNGLSLRGRILPDPKGMWLQSVLGHADGHEDVSEVLLNTDSLDDIKTLGARISYLRRYVVSAQLGIASDDDIDEDGRPGSDVDGGRGVGGDTPPAQRGKPAPRAPAPKQPLTTKTMTAVENGNVPTSEPAQAPAEPAAGAAINASQANWVKAKMESFWTEDEQRKFLAEYGLTLENFAKMSEAKFAKMRKVLVEQ